MAKLLGRCGWWRRCSCCNDRKTKKSLRAAERRQWKKEANDERMGRRAR